MFLAKQSKNLRGITYSNAPVRLHPFSHFRIHSLPPKPMASHSSIPSSIIISAVLALPATHARDEAPTPKQVRSAAAAGLKWLADQQIKEGADAGSWGNPRYQTATAGFAGLAFLANGHLPGKGEYGALLDRAMQYMKPTMTPDGYLGAQSNSMYVHAICTLFGLSYLGLSENPDKEKELAEWCLKSVRLIIEAQKVRKRSLEQGGWRYTPFTRESDLSVTSWQLLTLHAARQCGFEIEQEVFDAAMKYINRAYLETEEGKAGFLYRVGTSNAPEPAVTGVAVFMKSLFERESDDKITMALKYLEDFPPNWGGKQYNGFFFFGSFYMAQGMFQIGGKSWQDYAPKIQKVLIDHQEGDGHWGFPPDNKPQSHPAGHAYTTALAVLILSLDKQYLPMYQRQKQLF